MSTMPTVFEGEVQLLRWSETSNQGATITLQLSDAADLERFKTMTLAKGKQAGQRLMAAMVEIGDDEKPVEQPVLQPQAVKQKVGDLCIMACAFCADPMFWRWVNAETSSSAETEQEAKDFILYVCCIDSRKELDTNLKAARQFHLQIREPFLRWKRRAA